MPKEKEIKDWVEKIRSRYENYLKTLFYFKEPELRRSFSEALRKEGELLKGPYPEPARHFQKGVNARELAKEYFPDKSDELVPALLNEPLYKHQEDSIRKVFEQEENVIVATGTASGKTESFLYPILFSLYREYLEGNLDQPGVRAMILYPMNALANDQRERLGEICQKLKDEDSGFEPTFGQYIGQTPENEKDTSRNAPEKKPGEKVFREEMREKPPHILLTNYSMLEYLLIRPYDSPLFDNDRGQYWQFIVLDEAHQYRGARGMEMGMLIRRLKQRLRDGGRGEKPFRCIGTSATLASGKGEKEKRAVADFATELFGETFLPSGVIFDEEKEDTENTTPARYHVFVRALEGAFLIHRDGKDEVVLNRQKEEPGEGKSPVEPLEIALCHECGQHYYVGHINSEKNGKLTEAVRDPSQDDFGVHYYLPLESPAHGDNIRILCRRSAELSPVKNADCKCDSESKIYVQRCENYKEYADRINKCEVCNYGYEKRGRGINDPVQEVVHGSDGPNAVIATALHELLPEDKRKVLAFADGRQEAAFFAWYVEDTYKNLRDRNLIFKALTTSQVDPNEGLSLMDLRRRIQIQLEGTNMFPSNYSPEDKQSEIWKIILPEALTDERRLSLAGVGLAKWFVKIPDNLKIPRLMLEPPWSLKEEEARELLSYLLDNFRLKRAMKLPQFCSVPWDDISPPPYYQKAFCFGPPRGQKDVIGWNNQSSIQHLLGRILTNSQDNKQEASQKLIKVVWDTICQYGGSKKPQRILLECKNSTFRLNPDWVRIKPIDSKEFGCDTCASPSAYNIRGVCPRNKCPGTLVEINNEDYENNHYRNLYKNSKLPPIFRAEEHTAQINSDQARTLQEDFKNGDIHLLSSSTTYEVGVDLGDLEVVFLRNVPPEPFNYTQRVGRAGRREGQPPGFVLTYCTRNPHGLYHYEDPKKRIMKGKIQVPRLKMTNKKIISRHIMAVALSAFFKRNKTRFENVSRFICHWVERPQNESPQCISDFKQFCKENESSLSASLRLIVPDIMHEETKITSEKWIDEITHDNSKFALATREVCNDYVAISKLKNKYRDEEKYGRAEFYRNRLNTIFNEEILSFLSRKAVIPKYGFPVDVVELDTGRRGSTTFDVLLQRDLSQAIAEYAPGAKVVAKKQEWESYGVKVVSGQKLEFRYYTYEKNKAKFRQLKEHEQSTKEVKKSKKYLYPKFGFVTKDQNPKDPKRKAQRLYTTQPFFSGFDKDVTPETKSLCDVKVTKAVPGKLVILCEGKKREGFYICQVCGMGTQEKKNTHKKKKNTHTTREGRDCDGTLECFSLGYELETDVVHMQFPDLTDRWEAYSLAYAILLGAAESLDVPTTDLNVTITGSDVGEKIAIILYDNVPGGAALVTQLEQQEDIFYDILYKARKRVLGNCGCDVSCYGCLRSYRNQFVHPHLDRKKALRYIEDVLQKYTEKHTKTNTYP